MENQETQGKAAKEKKNIVIVAQRKGGAGKSAVTYSIANLVDRNHLRVKIYDGDHKTGSTTRRCAFLKKKENTLSHINFYDDSDNMDRNKILSFFTMVSEDKDHKNFLVDLGAATSQELLVFIQTIDIQELDSVLAELNIDLKLLVIVCGGNTWNETFPYFEEIHKEVKNCKSISLKPVFNTIESSISQYHEKIKAKGYKSEDILIFETVKSMSETIRKTFEQLSERGAPINSLSPFEKMPLNKGLNDLNEKLFAHGIFK